MTRKVTRELLVARDSKARAYALKDECAKGDKQPKANVASKKACLMEYSSSSGVQCHEKSGGPDTCYVSDVDVGGHEVAGRCI